MRTVLLALVSVAVGGCATAPGPVANLCPGSPERCLTIRECTRDRRRDCEVCVCRAATDASPAATARPENPRDPQPPPIR